MSSGIRAASVQFEHENGNKESNFKKIESFVKKAATEKVQILLFPVIGNYKNTVYFNGGFAVTLFL